MRLAPRTARPPPRPANSPNTSSTPGSRPLQPRTRLQRREGVSEAPTDDLAGGTPLHSQGPTGTCHGERPAPRQEGAGRSASRRASGKTHGFFGGSLRRVDGTVAKCLSMTGRCLNLTGRRLSHFGRNTK
ncbi:hypothetical protein GCM10018791_60220 [Streptomyces zaomyceticus]|nr:hypothetical protein GCM10018791_60220 [Streptomyces zaomyceticus]